MDVVRMILWRNIWSGSVEGCEKKEDRMIEVS